MFEERCHQLDLKLFTLRVQHTDDEDLSSTNFDQKVAGEFRRQQQIAHDVTKKQQDLEQVEEVLPLHLLQQNLQNADMVFREMANKAFTLRRELEDLVSLRK